MIKQEYRNIKTFLQKVTSEEVSVIKKVKNTVPWTYIIGDLKDEGAAKKKDNKLYVKCKDCDNSFNSWPDKKDII